MPNKRDDNFYYRFRYPYSRFLFFIIAMYSIRHFLLAALTALSYSALVESAALSAGHQMARQKAFANLAIHAARTDLGADRSPQQSGGNQLSTAARWALVSELRDQIDEIKTTKQQEHG